MSSKVKLFYLTGILRGTFMNYLDISRISGFIVSENKTIYVC